MNRAAALLVLTSALSFGQSWTGRLVDAVCKTANAGEDSFTALCPATPTTHLFALQLPNSKVLILNAAGNEKADDAIRNALKTDVHVRITGSRDGSMVRVQKIEIE
jgi:hypothetical protein